jgi:hypothetical protein
MLSHTHMDHNGTSFKSVGMSHLAYDRLSLRQEREKQTINKINIKKKVQPYQRSCSWLPFRQMSSSRVHCRLAKCQLLLPRDLVKCLNVRQVSQWESFCVIFFPTRNATSCTHIYFRDANFQKEIYFEPLSKLRADFTFALAPRDEIFN